MNTFEITDIVKHFVGQANTLAIPAIFKKWLGSYNVGILLAQILYWSERTDNEEGWFFKSYKDWENELFLTEKETRNAISKLEELDLIETKIAKVSGVPTKHFRLKKENFNRKFTEFLKTLKSAQTVENKGADGNLPKGRMETYQRTDSLLVKTHLQIEEYAHEIQDEDQASEVVAAVETIFLKTPSISCQGELRAAGIKNLELWKNLLRLRKAGMTDSQFENFSYVQKSIAYALQDYQAQVSKPTKKSRYTPHGTIEIDWNDPRNPFLGLAVIE